jgi:glycosyltransferase involved in cell wall biosynthesis
MIAKSPPQYRHLTFVLDHLSAGGRQKTALSLGRELIARGHRVDLVVCQAKGPLLASLPFGIRLFELERRNAVTARLVALLADPGGLGPMLRPVLLSPRVPDLLLYTADLASYLRHQKPDTLVATNRLVNVMAVWAARLAGGTTRVVVSERNPPSLDLGGSRRWRRRYLPPLMARTYQRADAIVAVSRGVAADLADLTGLPAERIKTIHNPVVSEDTALEARMSLSHPWFALTEPPVILGAGRFVEQKDFSTLIRAFARLRRLRPVRLVILGGGKDEAKTKAAHATLIQLAVAQGVGDDIALPGLVSNPLAFMARAGVFVLSSRYEGLPTVLIEALACGCPVVSTDCPGGAREVLESGRFGELVPVGDDAAMAEAILRTLDRPPDPERLMARGQLFSVAPATDAYLGLCSASNAAPAYELLGERRAPVVAVTPGDNVERVPSGVEESLLGGVSSECVEVAKRAAALARISHRE